MIQPSDQPILLASMPHIAHYSVTVWAPKKKKSTLLRVRDQRELSIVKQKEPSLNQSCLPTFQPLNAGIQRHRGLDKTCMNGPVWPVLLGQRNCKPITSWKLLGPYCMYVCMDGVLFLLTGKLPTSQPQRTENIESPEYRRSATEASIRKNTPVPYSLPTWPQSIQ